MFVSDDLTGQTLAGRYRLLREIGRGGMGVVYEAEQLDLKRRVAVKVVVDTDERTLERFKQEALATANLACPNVVTVLEFRSEKDEPSFLAMELLEGESLHALIAREAPLPVIRAVDIAAQMLNGLAAAHRAGIVHRDVKPSNVFLVRTAMGDDVVKLLDFGVAKVRESSLKTTTGALTGTPAYVSPEQLRAHPVDARTDLHAVGLCLFEMLTGQKPWRAVRGTELSTEILREAPLAIETFRKDIPPDLANVISRSLSKEPAQRHADANAMVAALKPWIVRASDSRVATIPDPEPLPSTRKMDVVAPKAALAPKPVVANVEVAKVEVAKPRRRRRSGAFTIFLGAALGVIVLGLAIGIVVMQRRATPPATLPLGPSSLPSAHSNAGGQL